ncbi:hypothetical protein CU098_004472, partial [Rhizopus stolonifer]
VIPLLQDAAATYRVGYKRSIVVLVLIISIDVYRCLVSDWLNRKYVMYGRVDISFLNQIKHKGKKLSASAKYMVDRKKNSSFAYFANFSFTFLAKQKVSLSVCTAVKKDEVIQAVIKILYPKQYTAL